VQTMAPRPVGTTIDNGGHRPIHPPAGIDGKLRTILIPTHPPTVLATNNGMASILLGQDFYSAQSREVTLLQTWGSHLAAPAKKPDLRVVA
jgi:hypothetical protein